MSDVNADDLIIDGDLNVVGSTVSCGTSGFLYTSDSCSVGISGGWTPITVASNSGWATSVYDTTPNTTISIGDGEQTESVDVQDLIDMVEFFKGKDKLGKEFKEFQDKKGIKKELKK